MIGNGGSVVKMPSRKPVVTEEVLTYESIKLDRLKRTTIIENPVLEKDTFNFPDSEYSHWQ